VSYEKIRMYSAIPGATTKNIMQISMARKAKGKLK